MTDHTKAPWAWQAESKNLAYLVEADDATIVARLSADDVSNNFSRVAANACRIVACVNACEGIETAELNEYCAVSAKEYQDIERQRDLLLEALDRIVWNRKLGEKPSKHVEAMERIATNAIACVKGGAA